MKDLRLETDSLSVRYDQKELLLVVTYRGVLKPDVTAQLYSWLGEALHDNPTLLTKAKGSLYDFRQVTKFENQNLTSAQRHSQNLNQKFDLSHHPVALIVADLYQEQLLRVMMKIQHGQNRKRIVYSYDEACAFIREYHFVQLLLED